MRLKRALLLAPAAALLALAGCGGNEAEERGGVSAEEARQLDNAAAMLDNGYFDASPDSLVAEDVENGGDVDNAGAGEAEPAQ
jgi:hypothetical protein